MAIQEIVPLAIRPTETSDLRTCAEILSEAYRGFIDSDGWDKGLVEVLVNSQANHHYMSALLAEEVLLVACRHATVVGFTGVRDDEITCLYVRAHLHRQNIGSRLLAAAERIVRAAGHSRLVVHVAAASALPFYQAAGMQVISELLVQNGPCAGMKAKRLEKAVS